MEQKGGLVRVVLAQILKSTLHCDVSERIVLVQVLLRTLCAVGEGSEGPGWGVGKEGGPGGRGNVAVLQMLQLSKRPVVRLPLRSARSWRRRGGGLSGSGEVEGGRGS